MFFRISTLLTASLLVISALVLDAGTGRTPDAQMKAVLDSLAALGGKPIDKLRPAEARKQPTPADAVTALLRKQGISTAPEPVGKIEDRTIPVRAGMIPVRLYHPNGSGPFPLIVYFHGGGWVIADKDVYDSSTRALTNRANAIVMSVDYRQGPEHRFPAAHDDAYDAYLWATKNAGSFNGDPERIAVAGESAGGNLAVAVSLMARDQGQSLPKHVLAVYPIAGSDTNTPSYRANAGAKPLNKPMMEWFFRHYLRSPADAKDPRIDLVSAKLNGLPSTTIITAEIDPLRSEGERLAENMKLAGVDVHYQNYESVTHEFFGMSAAVEKAKQAQQLAAVDLKTSLNK